MGEIKIKLPEELKLTEEEKEKIIMMGGPFREPRRSGCMLILILPLILSLTMIFLISL
jgi:hypothetical protein